MNTRSIIENYISPVALSVAFNQDASCFSVGQDSGFSVYNSDPCQLRVSREFGAGISIIQMIGKSNFLGIVGGGKQPMFSQNKVVIWDDAKQKIALQICTPTTVSGVRISKTHIVIILRNSVRVYNFRNPPELWHAFETTDNPLGLCCLDSKFLAFPGRTSGQVQLVELSTGNVSIILAHGTSLRALSLSRNSQLLATASEIGTLIRVFTTHNCARIAELRRGVDQAVIFSIAISPSCLMLAATSNKSTLHIFDIPNVNNVSVEHSDPDFQKSLGTPGKTLGLSKEETESRNKWGILGKLPILPRVFSDHYSFASAIFETGEDNKNSFSDTQSTTISPKGIIGWINDENVVVVGAGSDCRWEKFVITGNSEGRRFCTRCGWKKYLTGC